MQRIALEETRLSIPRRLVGDVIYGHRTVFSISLAEAGAFDPIWERTARVVAAEAPADGLAMTYLVHDNRATRRRWAL